MNMATANMLLSVFFLSGALADCQQNSGLFITTPQDMEALSGSCVQIPCNFRVQPDVEFSSEASITGMWITDVPHFSVNTMRVIGNLWEKNCTTIISNLITTPTNIYYFRIDTGPITLPMTAKCDPLQITVSDFAPSPRIEVSGDLKDKESVTITCSAVTPCPHAPPKLTWNLRQDPHHSVEENTDGTFTSKIQETITLSDRHDGYNISCSARYPVDEGKDFKRAEERKTLRVSYPPKDTTVDISPTVPVSVGSMVNLSCSCRVNPPVSNFVWFMISGGRLEMIKVETQAHGFRVTDSDRGRSFFCGCRNDQDIQFSTGRQLIFDGDEQHESMSVQVIVMILGTIMLISMLVAFECWFRSSRQSAKPIELIIVVMPAYFATLCSPCLPLQPLLCNDTDVADYVNTVTESS